MDFIGVWHIQEMELWDEDYFNMEVQAYIEITSLRSGHFQFGLVSGHIDGKIVDSVEGKRFAFTWAGNDELDEAFGSGWIRMKEKDIIEGEISFYQGDTSTFIAKRA